MLSKLAEELLALLQENTTNQVKLIELCDTIAINQANPPDHRAAARELSRHLQDQLIEFNQLKSY